MSGRRSSRVRNSASTRTSRSSTRASAVPPSSVTTLPVAWRSRDERYAEKLATPDTSVADLIGDVDPMKVAEGRSLGDPETIHFGLIPRSTAALSPSMNSPTWPNASRLPCST